MTKKGRSPIKGSPGVKSYFMQPGGNYRLTTSCDTASPCVFFLESKGKFGLKVVNAAK